MKLFTRYNRINLTAMLVLLILSGIGYYFLINYVMIHELDEALDDYRKNINLFVERTGELPGGNNLDQTRVEYLKALGNQQQDSVLTVTISEGKKSHKYRQLVYTQNVGLSNYRVSIAKPIEGIQLLTRTVVGITITMLLAVIGVSLLLNQVILKRLWMPFYTAMSVMKTFRLGSRAMPDFPETDIDEFVYMNTLLKDTISNAEFDYTVLKEFTENASHEIQTPLAIIRSKLDLVIQEEGLSQAQTQALGSIYAGIKRLTKLNQSLLLLAKIENNQFSQTEVIDFQSCVHEKLGQFRDFWQDNGITIDSDLQSCLIKANAELLEILLNNLLSNSGRHNVAGGRIYVFLGSGEFYIENTGANKPLDMSRLFRRFYKEEQHSQHNGLGLSIVKQICDQLGLVIEYAYSDGTHRFTLKW